VKPKKRPSPQPTRTFDAGALLVAAAAFVCYLPALSGGFVWDDAYYVADNPILRMGLADAIRAIATAVVVGNYHPLTIASFALEAAAFGLKPAVFHGTNLVLHAANAVCAGRLFQALGIRRDAAWAGALLWAVHPLRVESVAWISARKDLLYVSFFLLALIAYARYGRDEARGRGAYAASLVLFACSALSKAMAVSLVPVMLLVDHLLGRRPTARRIAEKVPFALLALIVGTIAIAAQRSAGATPDAPEHGWLARVVFACYGLGFYLMKTVAPWGLSAFYPYPARGFPPEILAVAAAALAIGALVWRYRRARWLVFGAGFYAVTVAPVLQILPVGGAVAADRYAYLPAIGLSFLIAFAIGTLSAPRRALAAVALVAAVLGASAWARCAVWRDGLSLWNDVLRKHPGVAIAHQNRGVALEAAGDHAGAIADYDAALAAVPGYADAWANRGVARASLGDRNAALRDLREAVRLDPARATFRFNLGIVLGDLGSWDGALAQLGEAIRLNPLFAEAHLNRGLALEQMGRAAEGAADVRRAAQLGYPVDPSVLQRFARAR